MVSKAILEYLRRRHRGQENDGVSVRKSIVSFEFFERVYSTVHASDFDIIYVMDMQASEYVQL